MSDAGKNGAGPSVAQPVVGLALPAIVRRPVAAIRPDPRNPRTHDEYNVAVIAASLHAHGQPEPLLVRRGSLELIAGHGRLAAMERLGWTECNVVELDLSDAQAKALAIRLNRTAETAGWNPAELVQALEALADQGFDPEVLGFTPDDVDRLFGEAEPETEAEAETEGDGAALKDHPVVPPPKMAWVLIGIAVERYGEIDRQIRALAGVPGILCEAAASTKEPGE
jgi:ParB-like chromosome segregation protein Spo0J